MWNKVNIKIREQLPDMTKQSKVTDRHKKATENNTRKKAIMKKYADWRRHAKIPDMKLGDVVLVKQPMKNKLTPLYNPEPLVVTKVKGALVKARNRNKSVTRNVSHLKPVKMPVPQSDDESNCGKDSRDNTQRQDNDRAVNRQGWGVRRSSRIRRQHRPNGQSIDSGNIRFT